MFMLVYRLFGLVFVIAGLAILRRVLVDVVTDIVGEHADNVHWFHSDQHGPAVADGTLDEFDIEYRKRFRQLNRWIWVLRILDPFWWRAKLAPWLRRLVARLSNLRAR